MKKLTKVLVGIGLTLGVLAVAAGVQVLGAEPAQAYTDRVIGSCQKITDYYYQCYTKRDFNWFEEAMGFRDFWYWKRV